jgi:CRISPR type III-A/MTUBE-associated protein Csm6
MTLYRECKFNVANLCKGINKLHSHKKAPFRGRNNNKRGEVLSRVLFSTLGMTDPIRYDFDGPLLHILRYYQPEKVYLFMTKRVCELADLDDRYRNSINRLCRQEDFPCEIIELRYEEIDNPQLFDIFYPIFEKELIAIYEANPGSQILVNLSSGTPQMKSACQLVALTAPFPILPIQVTTPNERENYGISNFELETFWQNNIDNHAELGSKNRCLEVESNNLRYLFLREAAISHLKSYDYNAALDVLKTVQTFVSEDALHLLEAAKHRKNMELRQAQVLANRVDYDLFPIKSSDVIDLFEYLLRLSLQQKTGELIEFVRGISPALTSLFENFLKVKCQRKVIQDYCYEAPRGSGYFKLSRSKLQKEAELLAHYDREFGSPYKDSYLSCATLLPMITFDCGPRGRNPDQNVVTRVQLMRAVEERIRNYAAHNIGAVTEEQFVKETGISSGKLLQHMFWMFKYTFPQLFKEEGDEWNSYDKMNIEIIRRLKR